MPQKILDFLNNLLGTPLGTFLLGKTIGSIGNLLGLRFSNRLSSIDLSLFTKEEIENVINAFRFKDVAFVKDSHLVREIYANLEWEDVAIFRPALVQEGLSGPVMDYIPYEMLLELIGCFQTNSDMKITIKES